MAQVTSSASSFHDYCPNVHGLQASSCQTGQGNKLTSACIDSTEEDDVFEVGEVCSNDAPGRKNLKLSNGDQKEIPRRSSLAKGNDREKGQSRKKTVSFSSLPSERGITNASDCLSLMQKGSDLIKVRSSSRQYHRHFSLDRQLREIRWYPSSKKPQKARIFVDEIKEILPGKNTDVLRNRDMAGHFSDECAFSIIYGDNFDTLDLIANTPDEASIWVTGLTCLTLTNSNPAIGSSVEARERVRNTWLQEEFKEATHQGNEHVESLKDAKAIGQLEEGEALKLMKRLNTGLEQDKLQQKFKELSVQKVKGRGRLSSDEFVHMYKELSTRPEIYFLLVRFASQADYMTVDDLQSFLENEQELENVSIESCQEIIERFEPSREGKRLLQLGIDGFTSYLMSAECDIFDPVHDSICQDMDQPLSHYFIAASHNTYLMADQLKGPSSIDGYMRALLKGCRYIEMHCWDGPHDQPVVYHGHTLTSKISAESIIDTIDKFAFAASQFPLILSIENHCTMKQQITLVRLLTEKFGGKLFNEKIDQSLEFLPSPKFLKNRIIIRSKKLPTNCENEDFGYVTDEEKDQNENSKLRKQCVPSRRQKLAKELSDLVNYLQTTQFQDISHCLLHHQFYQVSSISEGVVLRLFQSNPSDFVAFNKKYLTSIHPNGVRVDSSNFNPVEMWNFGCQVVTLNYQTWGLMTDLNDAKFAQNGGCGFVLKPFIMRDPVSTFIPHSREPIPGISPIILHIRIISGLHLSKPKNSAAKGDMIDPYVTVEVFGFPSDCAEQKTKTVPSTCSNPIFDESFQFEIKFPEAALVRFTVLDDDYIGDEFIGQYSIALSCMRTGYRHIQLRQNTGEFFDSCRLFVHIGVSAACMSSGWRSSRRATHLQHTGLKPIDECFKLAQVPLKEAHSMCMMVQGAMADFKQNCGLPQQANLKQCFRCLANRSSNSKTNLHVSLQGQVPAMYCSDPIPEILKRCITSFQNMMSSFKHVSEDADNLSSLLSTVEKRVLVHHEDIVVLASQAGFKSKKINKTKEIFSKNLIVLQGQSSLLEQCKADCQCYLSQIEESSRNCGLLTS